MLPLNFLYCCPPPPPPLPVFLSEGNQHPRHKWSSPSSWPRETREQAHGAEGEAVGLSCEGVPLLPASVDPGCGAESLLCHSWQMAWLQFHILSTMPPCRAPHSASSHLCFKKQWRSSHFLSDRLGKVSLSSSFYFYPKNKHKTQTKNQSVRNSHELTLWSLTKPSAMLSIPIWLS